MHTPGPWLRDGDLIYTLTSVNGTETNHFHARVESYRSCPLEELEANVCLIAAAPDLLSVAKEALDEVEQLRAFYMKPIEAKLRAAIAKAEGRS